MIDFYENLIRLRRRHPSLRKGSLRIIKGEQGLLVFARLTAEECLLTVVHQGIQKKEITLDLKEIDGIGAAKLHRLIRSDENGYNLGWEEIAAENGNADLTLAPRESDLYLLSR
jgi:alpha-glucosidase